MSWIWISLFFQVTLCVDLCKTKPVLPICESLNETSEFIKLSTKGEPVNATEFFEVAFENLNCSDITIKVDDWEISQQVKLIN